MYPSFDSVLNKPSAPPPPPPPSSSSSTSSSSLQNSGTSRPIGFSSLMSQPNNQSSAPYPGGSSSQSPYPTGPSQSQSPYPTGPSQSQSPYPTGPSQSQSPYPTGPPQSQSSAPPPYNNPYAANTQPPNSNNYSGYSLPNVGRPNQPGNPYTQAPVQTNNPGYQNPYAQQPPPQSAQTNNPGYQNPYQPQQQQPYQSPYQQQQPYQNPYPQQDSSRPPYNPQQPGGYPSNPSGPPPPPPAAVNDRIRSIAGRYEINDALAQRLNILQQFEIVILCDDSGSMNTPVDGTNGTRWDELRSIVQIVMEIGTVFDTNGVDVHFLNRPPMRNVTDARQVVESFTQRPGGLTPLTAALRQIFQSAASRPNSDKRLLVFVATDGAPTDPNGNVDVRSLENLMQNERRAQTTYVTFLACTDDEASVAYLSQWDRTMQNVDVVDDYKTEREEIRRVKGYNFPFSFGDYVVKALLGAVDPQIDSLDESPAAGGYNNNNNNYRRF